MEVILIEYTINIPTKIGKEGVFLDRLKKNNVSYDSSDIYSASEGLGITVSSTTLNELNMNIEQYIKNLKKFTKGIMA